VKYKWQVVAMLWFVVVLNYADRQALSGTLPLIRGELKLSPHEQGMLGAAFAWVYGLSSPFAGRLVDRIRRSRGVIGGLYLWSAICAATGFAPGFRSFAALRAAEGLGETAYFPASVSLISEYHEPRTRSRALAVHQTGVYVGIVGGTTAAAAIGVRFGWRWAFAIFGILGVVLAVILGFVLRDPVERRDSSRRRRAEARRSTELLELLKPAPLCLIGAFICANGVASVLFVWLPTFVFDRFHQTLAIAGFSSTVFAQAGSLTGALAGGWLADSAIQRSRSGRINVQAFGVWLGVPFVLLSGLSTSLPITLSAFVGWGFAKGLYEANIFASMFDITAAEIRGTVVGIMNMAGWLFGAGTAPILVGYIAERSSLGAAIASTAMIYVAAGVLLFAASRFVIAENGNGLLIR